MPKNYRKKNSDYLNKIAILPMKCIKSVNQNKKEINYKMYAMKLIHVNIIKKGSNVEVRSPILSNFKKCTSIKTIKTSFSFLLTLL